ncbi:MAG: CRTAC1 family protein, partial [Acidimicrobiales bacterium]
LVPCLRAVKVRSRRPMILLTLLLASGPRFVDSALERGLDLVVTFGSEEKNYIIERTGTGAGLSDYDGDGDLDVYLVNGSLLDLPPNEAPPSDRLYRNDGLARFTDVTAKAGLLEQEWGAGCLFADFDNDGDLDIAVATVGGPLSLLENRGATGNWLEVELDGFHPGAVITASLPDGRELTRQLQAGSSYLSSEDPRGHFGLGEASEVRELVVTWPDGEVTTVDDVAANQILVVEPPE